MRGFVGFIQNIHAVKELSAILWQREPDINFILLGKFNQDIVENLFAMVRGSGGYNNIPSVREIGYHLRRYNNIKVTTPALISNTANCLSDSTDDVIEQNVSEHESALYHCSLTEEINNDDKITSPEICDLPSNEDMESVIADSSAAYFIGYVENWFSKKVDCNSCRTYLTKLNESDVYRDFFIKQKNYENTIVGLKTPSDVFFDVCTVQINYFSRNFKNCIHIRNIKSTFKSNLIDETNKHFQFWFDTSSECYDHRLQILDFLILVLIRKNCYWHLQKLNKTKTDEKATNKLRKLKS